MVLRKKKKLGKCRPVGQYCWDWTGPFLALAASSITLGSDCTVWDSSVFGAALCFLATTLGKIQLTSVFLLFPGFHEFRVHRNFYVNFPAAPHATTPLAVLELCFQFLYPLFITLALILVLLLFSMWLSLSYPAFTSGHWKPAAILKPSSYRWEKVHPLCVTSIICLTNYN